MRDPAPNVIRLEDYTPPPFLIDTVELDVDIQTDHAIVRAAMAIRRNPDARAPRAAPCSHARPTTCSRRCHAPSATRWACFLPA